MKKERKTTNSWSKWRIGFWYIQSRAAFCIIFFFGHQQCKLEVRLTKISSLHGIVRPPISWLNPNSSAAWLNKSWNAGFLRWDSGITNRFLASPTYTAKCPLGTFEVGKMRPIICLAWTICGTRIAMLQLLKFYWSNICLYCNRKLLQQIGLVFILYIEVRKHTGWCSCSKWSLEWLRRSTEWSSWRHAPLGNTWLCLLFPPTEIVKIINQLSKLLMTYATRDEAKNQYQKNKNLPNTYNWSVYIMSFKKFSWGLEK